MDKGKITGGILSLTLIGLAIGYVVGLCCTNPVRDSSRESSVVAGGHEQTHPSSLQD